LAGRVLHPIAVHREQLVEAGERLADYLVRIALPHQRLRSLNGGKDGRSTNIGKFLVPANNEAPGRKQMLPRHGLTDALATDAAKLELPQTDAVKLGLLSALTTVC